MKKLQDIIQHNYQLIFTGAPGTGKSFSANELAENLTGYTQDNAIFKNRVEFVQFHPSYDYTDFMEGLKPKKPKNGDVGGFELRNGIFKEFCRKAGVIERIIYQNPAASNYTAILKDLDNACKGLSSNVKSFWQGWLNEKATQQPHDYSPNHLPIFVFIIDEINRAELSKVFGELMYCLEPEYRGAKGAVKTQYSYMNTEETAFTRYDDDRFFIPSNLYIIGTMNDIDRSVEVFDFALRRRFAWHEIKVKEVMRDVLTSIFIAKKNPYWGSKIDKLATKADNLNSVISSGPLNEHYHIGPSYFGKIVNYGNNDDAYQKLWNNHLRLLIYEYVRGMGSELEDKILTESKEAFFA